MQDIYLMQPINKTAALVTNQSGCNDDPTLEDQRDSCLRALMATEQQMVSLPKNHDYRKELGLKKRDLQDQLTSINKKIKRENLIGRGINEYVLQICRASTPRDKWLAILKRAEEMKQEDLKNLPD